ncbi:hypothetical protein, partial [Cohnella mopanensis]|uniref:hypothetical protein n=1 Tax=Cohnella mopanensis TaxID=2911966 RepID=UPI001EF7DB3D
MRKKVKKMIACVLVFLLMMALLPDLSGGKAFAATPISGITTFDNLSILQLTSVGSCSSAGSGLTAYNVDGWDITLLSTNSVPDCVIWSDYGMIPNSISIDGRSNTVSSNLVAMTAKSNDGRLFTLNSVDVGIDLSNGRFYGTMQLIGYKNGLPVAGAVLSKIVGDYTMETFNVSFNSAFQGIDMFKAQTDGTFSVNGAISIDNINATIAPNISFNRNGGTGSAPNSMMVTSGQSSAALPDSTGITAPTGKVFGGW